MSLKRFPGQGKNSGQLACGPDNDFNLLFNLINLVTSVVVPADEVDLG